MEICLKQLGTGYSNIDSGVGVRIISLQGLTQTYSSDALLVAGADADVLVADVRGVDGLHGDPLRRPPRVGRWRHRRRPARRDSPCRRRRYARTLKRNRTRFMYDFIRLSTITISSTYNLLVFRQTLLSLFNLILN